MHKTPRNKQNTCSRSKSICRAKPKRKLMHKPSIPQRPKNTCDKRKIKTENSIYQGLFFLARQGRIMLSSLNLHWPLWVTQMVEASNHTPFNQIYVRCLHQLICVPLYGLCFPQSLQNTHILLSPLEIIPKIILCSIWFFLVTLQD